MSVDNSEVKQEQNKPETLNVPIVNMSKIKQEKLSLQEWENMETNADNHLRSVLNIMRILGREGQTMLTKETLKSCGDNYATFIRPKLIKDSLLPFATMNVVDETDKTIKKKGTKKNKQVTLDEALLKCETIQECEQYIKSRSNGKIAKDDIIRINVIKILDSSYNDIITSFNKSDYFINTGFRNNYIEFRLITLMLCIDHATKHNIAESECFELAIATDRIIVALDDFETNKQMKNDMIALNARFKGIINFNHKIVCEKYPRMLFPTKYDSIIPMTSIKPYPNQIELIDIVKNNQQVLILLKTMIGGGKTTTAGALAEHVRHKRVLEKASTGSEKTQLLFVCSVAPVREQVGKIVWNMGIGLAIATLDAKTNEPKITKNHNCDRKDEKVVVILSDISSALLLLINMKRDGKNYVLFFDEPTVGADQDNHPITNTIPLFLKHGPEQIIFSSGTMPDVLQIPNTMDIYRDKYPSAVFKTITSKESYIGCEICSFDGETITPHASCTTVDELKFVIKQIDKHPLIARLYTAPLVYKIYNIMTDIGVVGIPNVDEYFTNVRNQSQYKVQQFALKMLQCLVDMGDDDLIKQVCVPIQRIKINETIKCINETISDEDEEEDLGFDWDRSSEKDNNSIDDTETDNINFDKVSTDEAYKYLGGCLIATDKPSATTRLSYDTLLKDKDMKLKNLISNYKNQLKVLETGILAIDKQKISDDEKEKLKQELRETNNPSFNFPECLQINTKAHLQKYCKKDISSFDVETIRTPFIYSDIDFDDTFAPDWLLMSLYSGSGMYDPDEITVDKTYLDNVLLHAERGRLAHFMAGHAIAYGTNFPLSNVVSDDDLCNKHSMNTLFQLINRAGRVGRSWTAHAYLGNDTIKRINDYIHGRIDIGTTKEAINIELAVERMHENDKKQHIIDEQREISRIKQLKEKEEKDKREKLRLEKEQKEKEEKEKLATQRKYPTRVNYNNTQWKRNTDANNDRNNRSYDRNNNDRNNRSYDRNNNDRNNRSYDRNNNDRNNDSNVRISREDSAVIKYKQLQQQGKYIPPSLKKEAEEKMKQSKS